MHKFDYSFLQNGLLPAKLLNISIDIYRLGDLSRERKAKFVDAFAELQAIAKVQLK